MCSLGFIHLVIHWEDFNMISAHYEPQQVNRSTKKGYFWLGNYNSKWTGSYMPLFYFNKQQINNKIKVNRPQLHSTGLLLWQREYRNTWEIMCLTGVFVLWQVDNGRSEQKEWVLNSGLMVLLSCSWIFWHADWSIQGLTHQPSDQ